MIVLLTFYTQSHCDLKYLQQYLSLLLIQLIHSLVRSKLKGTFRNLLFFLLFTSRHIFHVILVFQPLIFYQLVVSKLAYLITTATSKQHPVHQYSAEIVNWILIQKCCCSLLQFLFHSNGHFYCTSCTRTIYLYYFQMKQFKQVHVSLSISQTKIQRLKTKNFQFFNQFQIRAFSVSVLQ